MLGGSHKVKDHQGCLVATPVHVQVYDVGAADDGLDEHQQRVVGMIQRNEDERMQRVLGQSCDKLWIKEGSKTVSPFQGSHKNCVCHPVLKVHIGSVFAITR